VLSYVHRLEEFNRKDLEVSGHQAVVRYRGTALPILSVNQHLGYPETQTEKSDVMKVVVVERAGQFFGLEVDDIVDTLSTSAETNTGLSTHPCMIGNMTTDKELLVIIDPFAIVTSAFPAFNQASSELQLSNNAKARAANQDAVATKPARILVVEDSAFFRKIVMGALQQGGHTVTNAGDGLQAMDILNRATEPFDMIVSDIEMPRMNGFQFATAVRQNALHGRTPLLALSSKSDRNSVAQGTKAGFDLYLEKLKPEILLQAVTELTQASMAKKVAA
jgi:two-component system chemotaxis sensor kinase CheA